MEKKKLCQNCKKREKNGWYIGILGFVPRKKTKKDECLAENCPLFKERR